jgi:hypothetical protein
MNQTGKLCVTLAAAATLAAFGTGARAQVLPDLAFEGIDGMVQILADRRLERAGALMAGKGAMVPRNDMSGLSGAAGSTGLTGWIATGGNHLASTITDSQYTGDQFNGSVGVDMAVLPWLIAGVSLGFETRRLQTFFNEGTLDTAGGSISPYFVARLDENFFIDGAFSYTRLTNDVERNDFAFHPTVFETYGSDRFVGTVNLHGVWNIDNWRLGVNIGYLHVHQDDERHTQTGGCEPFDCDTVPRDAKDLGQVRGGARIGYAFGEFIPYVIGRLDYDVVEPNSFGVILKDRFGGFAGAGLRWNIDRNITAVAQGNTIIGRDHQTNYGGYATLRVSW